MRNELTRCAGSARCVVGVEFDSTGDMTNKRMKVRKSCLITILST
jgi:hypothetical protein